MLLLCLKAVCCALRSDKIYTGMLVWLKRVLRLVRGSPVLDLQYVVATRKSPCWVCVYIGCQKVSRGPICYVCVCFTSVFDPDSNTIMGGAYCVSGVASVKFYGLGR